MGAGLVAQVGADKHQSSVTTSHITRGWNLAWMLPNLVASQTNLQCWSQVHRSVLDDLYLVDVLLLKLLHLVRHHNIFSPRPESAP